jgi:hypothetical protein
LVRGLRGGGSLLVLDLLGEDLVRRFSVDALLVGSVEE